MTTSADEQIRKLEAQRNRIEERLKQLQAKQRRLKRKQSDGWKRKTGETMLQYAAILPENDEQQHCLKTALNTHVTVNGKDVTIANLLHSTYAMIVKDREEQKRQLFELVGDGGRKSDENAANRPETPVTSSAADDGPAAGEAVKPTPDDRGETPPHDPAVSTAPAGKPVKPAGNRIRKKNTKTPAMKTPASENDVSRAGR